MAEEFSMQDAMFSGLFGALTTEHRMNFIANNLANVNTTGYKQDRLAFKDTMAFYAHDEIREPLATVRSKPLFPEPKNMSRARIAVSKTDYSQGAFHYTGDPLDVAIYGENAFFRVETPRGEFLTRDGHFVLSGEGVLMTPQGYAVQGAGGNIIIPPGTRNISISADGQVFADNAPVNTIALVSVDNPQNLEKMGHNLYKPRRNAEVAEGDAYLEGGRLEQGFIETANVEVVTEMVNMIEVQRQFEAYQKVMQTADSLDRDANQKVGRRQG
jgi:flagellar basal-body rod protein FlgG